MKIEDQVCTLKQAKELKKLGINAKCFLGYIEIPSNGLGVHAYWRNEKYALINADIVMFLGNGEERWYAPNVSELGVMLPESFSEKYQWCWYHRKSWKGNSVGYCANTKNHIERPYFEKEAESRADLLIHLLENGHITATEVNGRLSL